MEVNGERISWTDKEAVASGKEKMRQSPAHCCFPSSACKNDFAPSMYACITWMEGSNGTRCDSPITSFYLRQCNLHLLQFYTLLPVNKALFLHRAPVSFLTALPTSMAFAFGCAGDSRCNCILVTSLESLHWHQRRAHLSSSLFRKELISGLALQGSLNSCHVWYVSGSTGGIAVPVVLYLHLCYCLVVNLLLNK